MAELKSYVVWDKSTRWFHWINVLCVLSLITLGLIIYNGHALGLSTEGKVSLKTLHVLTGYVFALNLVWRFIWAFLGNPYARWQSILPIGKGYRRSLRSYVASLRSGQPDTYLGHNPLGRLSVFVLFLLLAVQAVTGLVLAGTDLFYPPFGHWIAQWIAAPGVEPDTLLPYAKQTYDAAAYEAMRAFRTPFILVHKYSFFVLSFFVVAHIGAVVVTEIKTKGTIISAMFTGKKIVGQKPVDQQDKRDD